MTGTFRNSKRVLLLLFLFILLKAYFALAQVSPGYSINAFIQALNQGKFHKAYSYFSKPLREQVSFPDFRDAARQAKEVRLLKIKIISQNSKLTRAKIVVEGFEKSRENKWRKKQFGASIVLVPEEGYWKLIQVDIQSMAKPRLKKGKNK